MKVSCIKVGPIRTNCYIAADEQTGKGFVVDPGANADEILAEIEQMNAAIEYVIFTHAHYDHTFAAREVIQKTGAKLLMHAADKLLWQQGGGIVRHVYPSKVKAMVDAVYVEPDRLVVGGETIPVGGLSLEVLHAPGHTAGGILIQVENAVFTGDTLMRQTVGRTDFEESAPGRMDATLKNVVCALDDALTVYPGHGQSSDMQSEKRHNPYLRACLI